MMTKISDIAYGTEPLQRLDLYLPAQPAMGAVLYAHGGGWIRGDKNREADIGQALADAGLVCAVVNYRLAPAHRFPAPLADCSQALAWLRQSQYARGLALGLFGASAGGTMALNLSETSGLPVVAWSPLVDLAAWAAAHQATRPALEAQGPRQAVADAFYKYVLQAYLGELTPAALATADPLAGLNARLGATMIVNSTQELAPLTHALRFQRHATQYSRNVSVLALPGHHHARGYTASALAPTIAFFQYYLGAD